jgi:hypothetical protein
LGGGKVGSFPSSLERVAMNGNSLVVIESNVYSLSQILDMMRNMESVMIDMGNDIFCGRIVGIREEDGSGKCWLVTIRNEHRRKEFFVRTK